MAHFAKLDASGLVVCVTVGRDDEDERNLSARTGETYRRTSYNTRSGIYYDPQTGEPATDQSKAFRKNFAGIGYRYDVGLDAFIPPSPYPSWILNPVTGLFDAPLPKPEGNFVWSEDTQNWVLADATG